MNEETNTPETLAAVLAEMRDFCSGWPEDLDVTVKVGLIYGWMCRLKEAAERKQADHGNAAAIRGALVEVEGAIFEDEPGRFWLADAEVILHRVQAALSAPARNCDRFHGTNAVRDAFDAFAAETGNSDAKPGPFLDWLFAPAEGGAK